MTAVLQLPSESVHILSVSPPSHLPPKRSQSKSWVTHLRAISHSPPERLPSATDRAYINASLPNRIPHDAELIPYAGAVFNAKDYVFLGSCEMPVISNMGITLSETGRLVLIEGRCRDAISGLLHKILHNDGYRYYLFSELDQPYRLRFDHLYVNENGVLLGRIKDSECYYSISIDKKSSYHSDHGVRRTIVITYEKWGIRPGNNFMFYDKWGRQRGISFKDGDLFFISDEDNHVDHSIHATPPKISSSLNEKYRVVSVKRARNLLQIESVRQKKRRIFYLDPHTISIRNFNAKGISHKPPQTFYSCLGSDTHEKYYAGQPFSSRRLSNFSSAHIPLLSTAIDNIRCQTKKSKQCRARGKKKASTMPFLAKTIDPGIRALTSATRDITRSLPHYPDSDKKNGNHRHKNIVHTCVSLLHELPDSVISDKSYAGVSALLRYLTHHDSITFSNMSEFAMFFSLLHSGTPISPGWFFGVIVSIAKSRGMTLSKTENGNIRLSFFNKRSMSCNLLAGTGQGLESGKITSQNISLLSLMPFEANLVLSTYRNKENSLSFDMTEAQFQHFIGYATHPTTCVDYSQFENSVVERRTEYGCALSVDMKISELRAMIGIKPNANVNLLTPRFTGTLTLCSELLSLHHKRSYKTTALSAQSNTESSDITMRALTATGGPSIGGKIIVSPSIPNPSGKLGFRLALLEDSRGIKLKTKSGFKTEWLRKTPSTPSETPSSVLRQVARIQRMLESVELKGDVIRPIKRLRRVKVMRALQQKRNPFQARLFSLFSRTRHPSHDRLSRILKGHRNKREIIHTLREIRAHARHTQRASMNKRFNHYFVAKYTLNEEYQKTLHKLKDELAILTENPESMTLVSQRLRLSQLQRRVRQLQHRALYRLDTIEIKSIGEVSKDKTSLFKIIVSFKNSKTLAYTKHLGEIQFEYANHHDNVPQKITGNYHFL